MEDAAYDTDSKGREIGLDYVGMAVDFYESGRCILPGVEFCMADCCRLFKAADNACYERRKSQGCEKIGKRQESDNRAKECILHVVECICNGWVHGTGMLHDMILVHCGEHVNRKRLPRLLKEMGLKLSTRWSNPYLGHDTHDHPCEAFRNLVGRRFYIAPRKIILVDITYLRYGRRMMQVALFYKCSFIDAFTGEELGQATSKRMDVSLVMEAYADMMDAHSGEFPEGVIIHSDQGSQFLSYAFRSRVEEDGFRQSMSNRGNSLDNSPMESFFGTFKDENAARLLCCDTYEEAAQVVREYKVFYNHVRTHSRIGGWIPAAFYEHYMAHEAGTVVEEDSHHIPECMVNDIQTVIDKRLAQNKGYGGTVVTDKAVMEKKYQLRGGAEGQMDRDDKKLSGMIRKCEKDKAEAIQKYEHGLEGIREKRPGIAARLKKNIEFFEKRILELTGIKDLIQKARDFYHRSPHKVRQKLDDRRTWQEYPEMQYYKLMRGMF